jgi:hypothetical protein
MLMVPDRVQHHNSDDTSVQHAARKGCKSTFATRTKHNCMLPSITLLHQAPPSNLAPVSAQHLRMLLMELRCLHHQYNM